MKFSDFSNSTEFIRRHIGPSPKDIQDMLSTLKLKNLDELADRVVPTNIRSQHVPLKTGHGISEAEALRQLKTMMSKNKIFRSMIGMGYYDTYTPSVIQRNVLENPVWYTAYTPYQAEIAQGRLESLLNFQTMVKDLTGMEISNASLLDEGTAAAEAMAMAQNLSKNTKANAFVVSPDMHPHVLEVLKTRATPLNLKMIVMDPKKFTFDEEVFSVFFQYPNTEGSIEELSSVMQTFKQKGALVIAATDLLALTMIKPPGELGADIVVGNTQRFGVPMGYGGPHAAFLATKDAYKRNMPGRIVGVSVDSHGKPALRLALQTREQHIRREKATSNICTAQVLLANMAAMYAVYHGPKGLKKIAERTHYLAKLTATALEKAGLKICHKNFFDTVTVQTNEAQAIYQEALKHELNLRLIGPDKISFAFDETCDLKTASQLIQIFTLGKKKDLTAESLDGQISTEIPATLARTSEYLTHPVFNSHHSETELLRYIHHLQNKDLTLTHSMIPLGSCTMKLNATTELMPVSWPEIGKLHPFAPTNQTQGMIEMIRDLEEKLCDITGFAGVSLQPNAGSQGEYAGLLVIREYFLSRNEGHRNICLIPSSAHGTNPASAVMAGMKVVVVACDEKGNVDVADLRKKAAEHKDQLAALMITYPSTHGVFEASIKEICQIIHDHGGQVYMDGANMNALVALCRPAEFGADVSHMNLHKTFAIPHGGGGPGVGPIGVAAHLKPFLPKHSLIPDCGPEKGITATTSAPWGSASILPISWAYITMMGAEGLREATLVSILSANYIAQKIEAHFPVLYKGQNNMVAHECIIDLREIKQVSGIDVSDVAKRLIDYGFHAPTMSWPVAGTLMIEPTESEPKAEIDRFLQAMQGIHKEILAVQSGKVDKENNPLKNSPHTALKLSSPEWNHPYSREEAAYPIEWLKKNKFWPQVGRVDNVYGDRNVVCACPPLEDYQ